MPRETVPHCGEVRIFLPARGMDIYIGALRLFRSVWKNGETASALLSNCLLFRFARRTATKRKPGARIKCANGRRWEAQKL